MSKAEVCRARWCLASRSRSLRAAPPTSLHSRSSAPTTFRIRNRNNSAVWSLCHWGRSRLGGGARMRTNCHARARRNRSWPTLGSHKLRIRRPRSTKTSSLDRGARRAMRSTWRRDARHCRNYRAQAEIHADRAHVAMVHTPTRPTNAPSERASDQRKTRFAPLSSTPGRRTGGLIRRSEHTVSDNSQLDRHNRSHPTGAFGRRSKCTPR